MESRYERMELGLTGRLGYDLARTVGLGAELHEEGQDDVYLGRVVQAYDDFLRSGAVRTIAKESFEVRVGAVLAASGYLPKK